MVATTGGLSAEDASKLIVTGLTFGCIHVLAGADHLSALATLSVGSRFHAFGLGIRWGLGHSTGLIVVAAVLLSLDDKIDPTILEKYCNWIVGVFMIGLGVWGVFKAIKHEKKRKEALAAAAEAKENGEAQDLEEGEAKKSTPSSSPSFGRQEEEKEKQLHETELVPMAGGAVAPRRRTDKEPEDEEEEVELKMEKRMEQHDHRSSHGTPSTTPSRQTPNHLEEDPFLDEECEELDHWFLRRLKCMHVDIDSPVVQRIVAFSIGIIHGIAGPGGILGVLPAARLHSWPKATLYLGTFCITSTLIMGIFAALYGECTARIGQRVNIEFRLELFSAGSSIVVGILWLSLIFAGKLDAVFG